MTASRRAKGRADRTEMRSDLFDAEWGAERIAALAARLVSAPSENPDPDGTFEALAVDAIEREATALGLGVTRHAVELGRDNLLITAGRAGSDVPPIRFLGHSDVVPAGHGWHHDPFDARVRHGRLIGRGSADMKGGIAAVLAAFDVLHRDQTLEQPLEFLVTVDEEDRSTGVAAWVRDTPPQTLRACIAAEPTDLDVIVACRGAANLRLVVTGRAAHAGRPDDGCSAIVAAARIVQHLHEQHEHWRRVAGGASWAPTWNVGRIDGGHGTSIVADSCVLDLDRRMLPDEQPEAILTALLAELRSPGVLGDGISVHGTVEMTMPGFMTAEDVPLPRIALAAVRDAGKPAACIRRWTAACEGGILARHDEVPTIVLGPGDVTSQAHQPNESVAIGDLEAAAAAYVRLVRAIAADDG